MLIKNIIGFIKPPLDCAVGGLGKTIFFPFHLSKAIQLVKHSDEAIGPCGRAKQETYVLITVSFPERKIRMFSLH